MSTEQQLTDVVLHEEQLWITSSLVPIRRVRAVTRVVHEEVTVTVAVSRHVLELIEEDVENVPAHGRLPVERRTTVTLYEQRPVVTVINVPVEQVTLATHAVRVDQQITGELSSEQLQVDQEPSVTP